MISRLHNRCLVIVLRLIPRRGIAIFVVPFLLLLHASVCSAQLFAPAVNYQSGPTGIQPISIAVGDFNQDGKRDLAVANKFEFEDGTVSILLGNGDGTFQPHVDYAARREPFSVATGDFNVDGRSDLAVANYGSDTVSILLGNGNGTFQTAYEIGTSSYPTAVVVGDMNSDGKLDLAVSTNLGAVVNVMLGNGNGLFQPRVNYPVGESYNLALGDFNNDGKPDIATTSAVNNDVGALVNNGNGTFQPAVHHGVGFHPYGISVGDFNQDGKDDLVAANYLGDTVSVLLNASGTFLPDVQYNVGSLPYGNAVGDVNGDGKLDIMVTNSGGGSNNVGVLLGYGDGTFQSQLVFGTETRPYFVAVSDLNGDGRLDLAVANYASDSVSILLNVVPEPSTITLFGIGMLRLVGYAARRRPNR